MVISDIHDQPVVVFHEDVPHVAQAGICRPGSSEQAGIGVRGAGGCRRSAAVPLKSTRDCAPVGVWSSSRRLKSFVRGPGLISVPSTLKCSSLVRFA